MHEEPRVLTFPRSQIEPLNPIDHMDGLLPTHQFPKRLKSSHSCSCSEVLSTPLDSTSMLSTQPLVPSVSFSTCSYYAPPSTCFLNSKESLRKPSHIAGKVISKREENSERLKRLIHQFPIQTQSLASQSDGFGKLVSSSPTRQRPPPGRHVHPPTGAGHSMHKLGTFWHSSFEVSVLRWDNALKKKKSPNSVCNRHPQYC